MRTGQELLTSLDASRRAAFLPLWSVRTLMTDSIVDSSYVPDPPPDAIALTEEGTRLSGALVSAGTPEAIATLATFLVFAHGSLLVDLSRTDQTALDQFLDGDLKRRRIQYPWRFGKHLYDRYFELGFGQRDTLDQQETALLLAGSQPGIAQLGRYLAGPLGLLASETPRVISPHPALPLWSCPDVACPYVHPVHLSTADTVISAAVSAAMQILYNEHGQRDAWNDLYRLLIRGNGYFDHLNSEDLPWFLGDCLSDDERTHVLEEMLVGASAGIIRRGLAASGKSALATRSPKDVSQGIDGSERFQLILVCDDRSILRQIDSCILAGHIRIPATEVRSSKTAPRLGGFFSLSVEASAAGTRIGAGSRLAQGRLRSMVRHSFRGDAGEERLSWLLRGTQGTTLAQRLERYLQSMSPKDVLAKLILSGPHELREARAFMGMPLEDADVRTDEDIVDRLIYHLGYPTNNYPSHLGTFWSRLTAFRAAVEVSPRATVDREDHLRSAGANFFVSLEDFLDRSLSFMSWVLSSDHSGLTGFRYDLASARSALPWLSLGGQLLDSSGSEVLVDTNGRNTLWVLGEAFGLLSATIKAALPDSSPKPPHQLPAYVGHTPVASFGLHHQMLLHDIEDADIVALLGLVDQVHSFSRRSDFASLRNRLDHNRPDFPADEEVTAFCDQMERVANQMLDFGLVPSVHYQTSRVMDRYGRYVTTLEDWRGTRFLINGPNDMESYPFPPLTSPLVLVPGLHLRDTDQVLRFSYLEPSTYSVAWESFPRRMAGPNPHDINEDVLDGQPEIGATKAVLESGSSVQE